MTRMRSRQEICPYCHGHREVTVNLDQVMVVGLSGFKECRYGRSCIQEMRDKALLSPFEDGKLRTR